MLTNIPSSVILGSEQYLLAEGYCAFLRMVIQDWEPSFTGFKRRLLNLWYDCKSSLGCSGLWGGLTLSSTWIAIENRNHQSLFNSHARERQRILCTILVGNWRWLLLWKLYWAHEFVDLEAYTWKFHWSVFLLLWSLVTLSFPV